MKIASADGSLGSMSSSSGKCASVDGKSASANGSLGSMSSSSGKCAGVFVGSLRLKILFRQTGHGKVRDLNGWLCRLWR